MGLTFVLDENNTISLVEANPNAPATTFDNELYAEATIV